jgi:hypothetical protein
MKGTDMKKNRFVSLMIILFLMGSVSAGYPECKVKKQLSVSDMISSGWAKFKEYDDGTVCLYKKEKIDTEDGKHIVQYLEKHVLSDKGKQIMIQQLKEKGLQAEFVKLFDNLSYNEFFAEIDCKRKMIRTLYGNYYDANDEKILPNPSPIIEWMYIAPDDRDEVLQNEVCNFPKNKKDRWICFKEDDDVSIYYDRDTVNQLSGDIYRVWLKMVYTDVGKKRTADDTKNLDNIRTMIELDCKNEFYRVRSYHRYDKDGNALTKEISDDNETHPQPKKSELYKNICNKK